jgi:GNAT superfamily N-acetyltransferase
MGDVTIRDAREDELDAVAVLLQDAYSQYIPPPGAPLAPEERAAWDSYREEIGDVRSRLAFSTLIVAEDADGLLGGVTFYPPADGPGENHELPADWAGIRLLGVTSRARGRGVGRALTQECIDRSRALGAKIVGLHTTHLMSVAREMYKRMGFERVPEYDFFPMPDFTVEAYRLEL